MAVKHTFIHKGGFNKTKRLTALSALREKCLECSNWQPSGFRRCPCKDCVLYNFRLGKYPRKEVAGG